MDLDAKQQITFDLENHFLLNCLQLLYFLLNCSQLLYFLLDCLQLSNILL